jgi:hypothetical protein
VGPDAKNAAADAANPNLYSAIDEGNSGHQTNCGNHYDELPNLGILSLCGKNASRFLSWRQTYIGG